MKPQQLLFLCCFYSSLTVTCSIQVDICSRVNKSCVSSYWDTVTCVLNINADLMGQTHTNYNITFIDLYTNNRTSCPLVLVDDSYISVCKVIELASFHSLDEYDIQLCHESVCCTLEERFEPSQNIQLTPPYDVKVEQSTETFNITWKSGYEEHDYLFDALDHELLLQTSQSTENKTLHRYSQKSESIKRSKLKPNLRYCIKVRSKTNFPGYEGTWSQWSPSACVKNEAGQEQDNILLILIKSLGPACVAVGVLLLVFISPTARMKIKTLSHTPSPAPFFKPLYQQHEGNLQEWLSPKRTFQLTYKPEEILTTDAVIVVPKPTNTKDPEENQDLHSPPVTQLVFTQNQTSYVCLPGMPEAPPPVTIVGPGQTSYTRLPCSVWEVNMGEEEDFSTQVKDELNTSRGDSGCSSEDPTLSPDCSPPNSPVEDGPPKCFCTDYCILNKTADGFAPVLVIQRKQP